MTTRDHIEIWTDGACEPNPGPGAYGVHIKWTNGRITELDGFDAKTTNQRMELLGALLALEYVKKRRGRIIVYSDSQYVVHGITDWIENWKVNGWRNARKRPVANRDLWERLEVAAGPLRSRLGWQWVRGHDAISGNERADFLARRRLLSGLQSDRNALQAAVRGFSRHHDFAPGPYLELPGEDDEPSPDIWDAVDLWRTTAHRAMEESGRDEIAAFILMRGWYESDPALAAALDEVDRLIELLNSMEAVMPKEGREIRGVIGVGPRLKLIQGGKA